MLLGMERKNYIRKLENWLGSERRKPLILEGARQVGKTWLMKEFAKKHFKNVIYARFDEDAILRNIWPMKLGILTLHSQLNYISPSRMRA